MSLLQDKKLGAEQLRKKCDPASLGFTTTRGLSKISGLMGQQRAERAVNFGLNVNTKGYNIFIVGEPGSGRTGYAVDELTRRAAEMPAPDDWVYVYNFDESGMPLAISLPAGQAKELAKDAESTVSDIKASLAKAFDNTEYEDDKAKLVKEFQDEINELMEELRKWSESKKFAIKRTPQGFVNLPMIYAPPIKQDGSDAAEDEKDAKPILREMTQEEYEALSAKEQAALQKNSEAVSQKTLDILRVIREKEKKLKEKIKTLEEEICRGAIEPILSDVISKYKPNKKLERWFGDFTEDIIANFNIFLAAARDENAEVDFSRYSVNAFIYNDPKKGAPVIRETNPVYYNLVGKVEYESKQGNLSTDFRRIMPGSMHRANGGFLLLEADELLRQFMSWDVLKRVLRCHELSIENLGEQLGYIPVSSLRPEPIPVDMKVIIVGTPYLYYLLNIYDPEFKKIFKIKADFDSDMPRTHENEMQLAQFIAGYVEREGKLNFSAQAVAEVIEWSSRAADDQNKLCTHLSSIADILVESTAWARAAGKKRVGAEHVRKAIDERDYRSGLVEEKVREEFENKVIRIDTDGAVVGQINGLTVVTLTDTRFGSPVRITANVFMGREGIVNIEREVQMTGPIHNKGLLILSSYLGRMYSKELPLSVAARITFEQTYGGVEGDSASSTELYCLLSAISGVPIKQNIAVTGSVDQFGYVQPIGGVNEKIEGFYKYCKAAGLTGTQGVMIPWQNEQHLMLSHEVVEAVKRGKFHVWSVKTIDEGIEILTGVKAGVPNEKGNYPKNSIHYLVKNQLEEWAIRSLEVKKSIADKAQRRKRQTSAKKKKQPTKEDKDNA